MLPLLSINNLSIQFGNNANLASAANISNLIIQKGKTVALVGESGSGKSVTALSILRLLPENCTVAGEILFSADSLSKVNLASLSNLQLNKLRGKEISMIFQEPMTSLNPVLTCGSQVMEVLVQHLKLSKKSAREKTIELFALVELPEPATMVDRYPHQLSGGQKQRVMIAMALSCNPKLLIADEPTTALDVRVQQSILALLKKIQLQTGLAVLLITHDLGIVADVADEISVMYKGSIVEQGPAFEVLNNPQHKYTQALLSCRPAAQNKGKQLAVLSDFLPEVIQKQQSVNFKEVYNNVPLKEEMNSSPVLSVNQITVNYQVEKDFFKKRKPNFKAVDDVSFDIYKNETIGLVGESGCGKSTLAKTILQLIKPTSGNILLNGKDISRLSAAELRSERKNLQVVFQDPYGSLNPRVTIGEAIVETMKVHDLNGDKTGRKDIAISLLQQVQLLPEHFNRYPHQFSGGQRQRICIARALALQPNFMLFDESVSALDVSAQAQVLNLINHLKSTYHFTALFISHDLAVVHYISDRILVMQKGKIVEAGTASQVYQHPKNEYTQQLIAAIPGKKLGYN